MKLREIVAAIREYPGIRAELELAQSQLSDTRRTLEKSEQKCDQLSAAGNTRQSKLDHMERRLCALSTALSSFCPKLSTAEEMQRLYECIQPSLDADGFKLYFTAQAITGFRSNDAFPYEDACGRFEAVDGHQLMRYLLADRFSAVSWDIVPGTTYERATLGDIDTAAPEYQAFQKELYEKALRKMGFGNLLSPEAPQKLQNKETKGRSDHAR